MLLIASIAALTVTAVALAVALKSAFARTALDRPNYRSLHVSPVPRIGGIAMTAGVTAALALPGLPVARALWLPAALLMIISAIDDRRGLPASTRFVAQLLAACLFGWLASREGAQMPAAVSVTAVIAVVWMSNLYNFMDGANGMAGGAAVIGFGTYAFAALLANQQDMALAAASALIAAAALGFLPFNFPRARAFMGDAGAVPLGFLAAALGIYGAMRGQWAWWFGVLVFSPLIVDSTVTLLRRARRGEVLWHAHREHYYQRLIMSGWSHARTVSAYYLLMLASAAFALAAQNNELHWQWAAFWVITYSALLLVLERRFSNIRIPK